MKLAVGDRTAPFLIRPTVLVDDAAGSWHELAQVLAGAGVEGGAPSNGRLTMSSALSVLSGLTRGQRNKLDRYLAQRQGAGEAAPKLRKPVDMDVKIMVVGGWVPASRGDQGAEEEVGMIGGHGGMARWMEKKDIEGRKITAFKKFPSALADPGADIGLPILSLIDGAASKGIFNADATLGIVIGRPALRVAKRNALKYVAGITLLADLWDAEVFTEESRLRRGMLSKNLRELSPVGPVIRLLGGDDIADDLEVSFRLNGEIRQLYRVADFRDRIADVISYCSSMGLGPGDMLAMGARIAVPQAGSPLETPVTVCPGDTIELASPPIGVLTARLVEGVGWTP